jgi:hypothetical protein
MNHWPLPVLMAFAGAADAKFSSATVSSRNSCCVGLKFTAKTSVSQKLRQHTLL